MKHKWRLADKITAGSLLVIFACLTLILIALSFSSTASAQETSDLQGDSWRLQANTRAFVTLESNIEMPKCLVDEVISQCKLMFEGLTFNRAFLSGGTVPERLFVPVFRLVVEPVNPKYESGDTVIEVDGTILFSVMYVATTTGIVAVCAVSMLRQSDGETYIPVVFMSCGDDIMVPVL